jgi:hypothetical protein
VPRGALALAEPRGGGGFLPILDALIDKRPEAPDIIEFIFSDAYLDRPILFPRQATLLKLIFLQTELFTQYDYDVIGEWSEGFRLPDPERIAALGPDDVLRYEGNNGISPDVLDRVAINQAEGRPWFREVDAVIGRRGSKGLLGALCGSYVLWHYLLMGDPQKVHDVDRDKQLACFVYAAKKDQAKVNQWKDLVDVIVGGPCFTPFIPRGQPTAETLKLNSPADEQKRLKRLRRGIITPPEPTFLIQPKESTVTAGRGPAAFMQFYDEMAWIVSAVAKATAEEVYGSATPALDQFGVDAFIYAGSSPWQMMGQFYENYCHALEVDPDTRRPVYPEFLTVQLTSWDPYRDWERAHRIERTPISLDLSSYHVLGDGTGKRFAKKSKPVQGYDDKMRRLEKTNPETFAVERRSRWATAQDAYLNPERVDAMFGPWNGKPLSMQARGLLSRTYAAHGDPSKSGANFGFAIAHTEGPDARGLMHVVFDVIHAWRPGDFEPDGEGMLPQVDYLVIGEDLKGYIRAFMPETLTFDQFNSVQTIQSLKSFVVQAQLPKRVSIWERTATYEQNWKVAEVFKAALNMGLVHAPDHELGREELKFLQEKNRRVDHPTSGPVQTKDVADCLMICTYALIGSQMATYIKDALGGGLRGASQEGGFPLSTQQKAQQAVDGRGGQGGKAAGGGPARGRGLPIQGTQRGPRHRGIPRRRR